MVSETPCGWNSIFYKSSNAAFHSVARFIFFISFGLQNWFTTEFPVGITADRTW